MIFALPLSAEFSHVYLHELDQREQQGEVIWTQPITEPFDELILCWNGDRPKEGRIAFFASVQQDETWSPWLYYAEWGSYGQMLFQDDLPTSIAYSSRGKLCPKKGHCTAFRIQAIASGGASMESIRNFTVSTSDDKQCKAALHPARELESHLLPSVARQSQITLRHPRYQDLSMPTSACIALNTIFGQRLIDPSQFARQVLDENFDDYESWALNCAQIAYHLGDEHLVQIVRCVDFTPIYNALKQGYPSLIAIRGSVQNGPRPFYSEHTICIVGYDSAQQAVLCIDPAFPNDSATFASYPLQSLLSAWFKRGNRACIISRRFQR